MGLQNTFESIIPLSYVKGDCESSIMKYHNSQEANSENVLIFHFLKKLWVEAGNIA